MLLVKTTTTTRTSMRILLLAVELQQYGFLRCYDLSCAVRLRLRRQRIYLGVDEMGYDYKVLNLEWIEASLEDEKAARPARQTTKNWISSTYRMLLTMCAMTTPFPLDRTVANAFSLEYLTFHAMLPPKRLAMQSVISPSQYRILPRRPNREVLSNPFLSPLVRRTDLRRRLRTVIASLTDGYKQCFCARAIIG